MKDKKVEIKKQPRLGLSKTLSLTINGIKYRLFRSAVTMIVITVAIAFMMNTLSGGILKKNVSVKSRSEIAYTRLNTTWVSRLSSTGSIEDILNFCTVDFEKGSPKYVETQGFGGMDDAEMAEFAAHAVNTMRYMRWFNELKYENRRRLVHQAVSVDIFKYLANKDAFGKFESSLKQMLTLRFVDGDMAHFQAFLKAWPQIKEVAIRIRSGRQKAIDSLKESYKGQKLQRALCEADGDFGKKIEAAGFKMGTATAKRIADLSRQNNVQRFMEKRVVKMENRKEIAKQYDVLPKEVSALMLWNELLTSQRDAAWTLKLLTNQWLLEESIDNDAFKGALADKLGVEKDNVTVEDGLTKALNDAAFASWLANRPESKKLLANFTLTPEECVTMAGDRERLEKYILAERQCADVREDSFMGLGSRELFLMLVSLLVCIVGIANAMLMTVTERFREIATLKCLGALDGFIMMMFVFEATILGAVGGFFGSIFGGIIGIGRMRVAFGDILWKSCSASDMLIACFLAMIMGVIMAAMAAVYPSFKASRMAPMEAMRID